VTRLHAGLAVAAVVENCNREILWALYTDPRERPQPHQHLAIAGDDQHAVIGLCQGEAEPDHRGCAHRAPKIKVAIVVTNRGGIPGRRSKTGHEEQIPTIRKQDAYGTVLREFSTLIHSARATLFARVAITADGAET
jgi:hypothetical protein